MIKNFFKKNNIMALENASLKNYNTYRIDSSCEYLVFPRNEQELILILKELKKNNINYIILGNGSNIILAKEYYQGVVIKLDELNQITYKENLVTAGAGCSLIKLAFDTIKNGLSGLVFATGIPGCVGASTAMNAGAYNSDMSQVVKSVRVLNDKLEIIELNNKDLSYSYRDSFLKKHKEYIVLSTTFELSRGNIAEMKNLIEERKQKRLNSQPLNFPNAGSVFRNPEGKYAGELIEKCHLKGYNINGAEVSNKHANFIINSNHAQGKDIIELINKIQKEVKENYDVDLLLEQIIIE